jgi:hypothetical protein
MDELANAWDAAAVEVHLIGDGGGVWQLGQGATEARLRCDLVAYLRALSGRDPSPPMELLSGDPSLTQVVATARVLF